MWKFVTAMLAGVLASSGEPQPATLHTSRATEAEASIRSQLAKWVADVNSGKLVASNQIWSRKVIGWFPGRPDFTYETVRSNIAKGDRTPNPNSRIGVQIEEVLVDHNLAVVRDRWRKYKRVDSNSPWIPSDEDLLSFEVWQRGDQGWKIARWISAPNKLTTGTP